MLHKTPMWRDLKIKLPICNMRGLSFKKFGNPQSSLSFEDQRQPVIKAGEVLIKMLYSPINPSDVNQIEGVYPVMPLESNKTYYPGNEGCGQVVEVGSDVHELQKGDKVIFTSYAKGLWREFVNASPTDVFKVNNKLDPEIAAVLSVNPCSAYRMIQDYGNNKVIIQNAANSNVGRLVIQLAHLQGLKTINIVRNRPNIQELKTELLELGADVVLTEDELNMRENQSKVKEMVPTLALNAVGGPSATNISKLLSNDGVLVTYGGMSKKPITLPIGLLIFKNISFKGFWMTEWTRKNTLEAKRDMLSHIQSLVLDGKLKFASQRHFELSDFNAFNKGDKAVYKF